MVELICVDVKCTKWGVIYSYEESKKGGARDELGGVSSLVPDLHSGACSIQYMYGQWVSVVTNASVRTILL